MTALDYVNLLFDHRVAVLLQKAGALILHLVGKVVDDEAGTAETTLGKVGVLGAFGVELFGPGAVTSSRHLERSFFKKSSNFLYSGNYLAFLIQQIQNPQFGLNQVDTGLVVVEIDHTPFDSLFDVLFLLQFEHVQIELLLELLVGVVDAKLLERVGFERFES